MTTLRDRVLENPDDRDATHVYADWLEEQGDYARSSYWRLVAERRLWPTARKDGRSAWAIGDVPSWQVLGRMTSDRGCGDDGTYGGWRHFRTIRRALLALEEAWVLEEYGEVERG